MLRISNSAYDSEIYDLVEAARHDLILSGIPSSKAHDDSNPLIRRAIAIYTKANFGFDNPDSEKLQRSYDLLKMHLTLAGDEDAIS